MLINIPIYKHLEVEQTISLDSITKVFFLICDRDKLPLTGIKDYLIC